MLKWLTELAFGFVNDLLDPRKNVPQNRAVPTPDLPIRSSSHDEEGVMSKVIEYDNAGMAADQRCDRCGAQAYVEALLPSDKTLLFCKHHYGELEAKLVEVSVLISDHRKFLTAQEQMAH